MAKTGLLSGPGYIAGGIAAEVCKIWLRSVADVEVVLVTRLFVPERCRAISVIVMD